MPSVQQLAAGVGPSTSATIFSPCSYRFRPLPLHRPHRQQRLKQCQAAPLPELAAAAETLKEAVAAAAAVAGPLEPVVSTVGNDVADLVALSPSMLGMARLLVSNAPSIACCSPFRPVSTHPLFHSLPEPCQKYAHAQAASFENQPPYLAANRPSTTLSSRHRARCGACSTSTSARLCPSPLRDA